MGLGAKTLPLWLRKRRGRSKIVYPQGRDIGGGSNPEPEPEYTPLDFTNLEYWYDASQMGLADGANVTSCLDFSGNNKTLTPSSGSLHPTFRSSVDGYPAIEFGNFDNLKSTNKAAFDFLHTGESTTFWVIKPTVAAADKPLFSSNAAGVTTQIGRYTAIKAASEYQDLVTFGTAGQYVFNLLTANDEMPLNVWHLIVVRHKKGLTIPDSEMYIDNKMPLLTNTANSHSASTSTADPHFFINSSLTTFYEGYVREWGAYSRYLTDTELIQLFGGANFGL